MTTHMPATRHRNPSWLKRNIEQCEALLESLYFERDQAEEQVAAQLRSLRKRVQQRHCYERAMQDPDRVRARREAGRKRYQQRQVQRRTAETPTSFRLEL